MQSVGLQSQVTELLSAVVEDHFYEIVYVDVVCRPCCMLGGRYGQRLAVAHQRGSVLSILCLKVSQLEGYGKVASLGH